MLQRFKTFEWPTLGLLLACYALWGLGLTLLSLLWLPLGMLAVTFAGALHSSLQHEFIHHHPFRNDRLNEALVFPALTLLIPYQRFRDTHLAHHTDETLTDPYDDPESNYLDPKVWVTLPDWLQTVLRLNNTLLGRMLIGPAVGQIAFATGDFASIRAGNRPVRNAWLWHMPAVALVLGLVALAPIPLWAYAISVYLALSILKIRTFLEHRAHADLLARTVIVEDRGILALLFLNNNLHVVHHAHPGVPWFALPALYRSRRAGFLARNAGYRYSSYREVFARHFLAAKDPVPHPLMPATLDLPVNKGSLTGIDKECRDVSASDHRNGGLHAL